MLSFYFFIHFQPPNIQANGDWNVLGSYFSQFAYEVDFTFEVLTIFPILLSFLLK